MSDLKVGPRALALIHHFEQCRLTAYRDSAGKPTIGWGMTYYPDGRAVRMGERITQEQADSMFATILDRDFAGPVRALVAKAETTPAQFGAMAAMAYNVGMGLRLWVPGRAKGFRQSEVLKAHLRGDYAAAAGAFGNWVRGGGRVLPGLVRRRAAEAALYRSDFAQVARLTYGDVA